ncbi:MAG: aminoglycoside adenylyltransferase domain-containing protein, partial [Bacillota bacterium]
TEMQDLIELRKTLRQQNFGWYAKMLEGAFLPKAMLDPMQSGRALWWGTSGERGLQRNELGAFVLRITKEMGITIWGADLRREIPDIGHGEMIAEAVKWCRTVEQHGVSGRLHSVEWLLSTARMLLWLREGRFCSKSEAADWGYLHLDGEWRLHLPEAKRIRRQPELAGTMDVKAWLDGLMPAIKEAASDLRSELSQQRG